MTTPNKSKKKITKGFVSPRHLTQIELKAIAFVAISFLAGIAMIRDIQYPVVWAFLGTAIGLTLGQTNSNKL